MSHFLLPGSGAAHHQARNARYGADALAMMMSDLSMRGAGLGKVLQASDGTDALHQLDQAAPDSVHVVITDIDMPSMDGFELISRLAERQRPINLVATSARAARLLETVEALREGARARACCAR